MHKKETRTFHRWCIYSRKIKKKLSSFPPLFSPDFPSPNLSAIKYVDFSVYILACVPYLVGKQNIEYVRRSSSKKKGLCFLSIINSFCVPDMMIFRRPIKALPFFFYTLLATPVLPSICSVSLFSCALTRLGTCLL